MSGISPCLSEYDRRLSHTPEPFPSEPNRRTKAPLKMNRPPDTAVTNKARARWQKQHAHAYKPDAPAPSFFLRTSLIYTVVSGTSSTSDSDLMKPGFPKSVSHMGLLTNDRAKPSFVNNLTAPLIVLVHLLGRSAFDITRNTSGLTFVSHPTHVNCLELDTDYIFPKLRIRVATASWSPYTDTFCTPHHFRRRRPLVRVHAQQRKQQLIVPVVA